MGATESNIAQPFFWGVATSAYQSEGGYNGEGQPQTNWASAEKRGDVMTTGATSDFWNRYPEDFARCQGLGLNAFRLGIEWSRVQPTKHNKRDEPPAFDNAALDHYVAMFAECRAQGMEPVVTLHHFVHPAWLGSDPWMESGTAEHFEAYVRHTVTYVNEKLAERHGSPPLRYLITINEPNMLVLNTYLGNQFPGNHGYGFGRVMRAYDCLLTAHIRAYNAIHDIYSARGWREPVVTFNNYCSDIYWSDKLLPDLLCVRERNIPREKVKAYIHQKEDEFDAAFREENIPLKKDIPYYFGLLVKRVSNWFGCRSFKPGRFRLLLDTLYASPRTRLFDCVGLDYYDPFAAHAFRLPVLWDHEFKNKSLRAWVMNSITSKWWDWRVLPHGLHFFCRYYTQDFGRPLLIAENGMAIRRRYDNTYTPRRDKITRSEFLRLHVAEVIEIVNEGIPLLGYLHWSLFDNYEWGTFTPRFGLYSIDYAKGEDRLVDDHLGDRPSETYAGLIREARKKMTNDQ